MKSGKTLQLDKVHSKWLGVCAGVANYLEVEPWTVRLVFLGCIFFGGWFLVPMYFVVWYLLDDNSGQLRNSLLDNQAVKHFRTVDYRKKLYRNTREGKLAGVCAGIADYLEISALTVRILFLLLTFLTGFPILFYIGAMLVLEKQSEQDYDLQHEARSRAWTAQMQREADDSAPTDGGAAKSQRPTDAEGSSRRAGSERARPRDQYSQRREFQYCARKFTTLQQRLTRLEAYVTSNRFRLQREFRNMS